MSRPVHEAAYVALMEPDPLAKVAAARAAAADWAGGRLAPEPDGEALPVEVPGRPERPRLVDPRELAQRGLGTPEGRAALVHAVAHIEFNAINLALDAVYRFRGLPAGFYGDWLRVASEEADHFELLNVRLGALRLAYGDLPAHNGLWEMALATRGDVLERMALVPRVLEARGLDVTPGMIERLRGVGDLDTVAILERILREEEGHVAIGSRWYAFACERRGLDPVRTFTSLVRERLGGRIKPPLHHAARLRAGFDPEELQILETLASPGRATR
jgi:uncharacterized ferritin-like protein (DUF455 family)